MFMKWFANSHADTITSATSGSKAGSEGILNTV